MKIGILGHRFIEWGGGVDFLRIVCASLAAASVPTELYLLLPVRGPRVWCRSRYLAARRQLAHALGRPKVMSFVPPADALGRLLADSGANVTVCPIDVGDRAVRRARKHLGLDVVMPAFDPLPNALGVPWLGYLYDAQHRHLPQFFSPAERRFRDDAFKEMLSTAPAVIVNSRAVVADIIEFYPKAKSRVFAMPFSAAPSTSWFSLDPLKARARYEITRPYFMVCNQFWKHKDHATAFEAFAKFALQEPETLLICTGATSDYRDPTYFESLMRRIEALGIRHCVRVLGLISKEDQIALLWDAVALIQPTLFEGGPGGGSVYDAVSIGVPCVVSDIPVNRELTDATVSFFRAGDAMALAQAMGAAYAQRGEPRRQTRDRLVANGQARRKACGDGLVKAIEFILEQRQAAR